MKLKSIDRTSSFKSREQVGKIYQIETEGQLLWKELRFGGSNGNLNRDCGDA